MVHGPDRLSHTFKTSLSPSNALGIRMARAIHPFSCCNLRLPNTLVSGLNVIMTFHATKQTPSSPQSGSRLLVARDLIVAHVSWRDTRPKDEGARMEHGGLLPPPLALHLFPRAGITRAVPPGRLAPGFTAAPAAPSLPPWQGHSVHLHAPCVMGRNGHQSQTPDSIATGALPANACAVSALAILLIGLVASWLADYSFDNGVPHATTNRPP